ncbi:MAG: MBL fold metallo-hydrolase [Magnetococcales bacterium]|nr:MBL fold metallo-hydrolase [Magnetococcales bacterium]
MTCVHEILETGPLQVNCQILGDPTRGEALVVDPGGDAKRILARAQALKLKITHILATHGHFDHIGGVAELKQLTGAAFWIHDKDRPLVEGAARHAATWGLPFGPVPTVDGTFSDGDTLTIAGLSLEVIHTPGHTPGGVCFRCGTELIVGDTLFAGSIGRTDLPGGDYDTLMDSLHNRLLPLDDGLKCHPGHGPSTTLGRERRVNPFLNGSF